MLNSGDVVTLDLGLPEGSEAGLRRPAVVVTAQRVLRARLSVVQVVPLTTSLRDYESEVIVEPDHTNRLHHRCAAQTQHLRAVAITRVSERDGNVGPVVLAQIRDTIAVILDL